MLNLAAGWMTFPSRMPRVAHIFSMNGTGRNSALTLLVINIFSGVSLLHSVGSKAAFYSVFCIFSTCTELLMSKDVSESSLMPYSA